MVLNLNMVENSLAQEKGGEVGNPVSADAPKIKTIVIAKEKKEFDYCFEDGGDYQSDKDYYHEHGFYKSKADVNFLCVSDQKGAKKYTVLNKSAATKKGVNKDNSIHVEKCVNAEGATTVGCRAYYLGGGIDYELIPKKVLEEAGTVIETVKYCTLVGPHDAYECELVGSKNMETTLVSLKQMDLLKIPKHSQAALNSEMTDIKNCIVNEWKQVRCDALRPNGDKAILYTDVGSSVIKGLNLKVINTCETITKDYVTCQGNVYKLNKESLGTLNNVMLTMASGLGVADNKCRELTDKSVYCNGSQYLRVTSENDSSRSLVKELESTGHSEKNQGSKTSSK